MITGVYKIKNIINDDCYIGSCSAKTGIKHRWRTHVHSLKRGRHHSIILQRAWNKYGETNFQFEILETCIPSECIKREQFYLDTLNPKYNILPKAGSCLGRKLTPEHIQKLKDRSYNWMIGDKNWNKSPEKREFYRRQIQINNPSQYLTKESFQKISEFHKGKPKSEIQKQRMSEASLGKPKSKEHVEKMRENMKIWAQENMLGNKNYFHSHKYVGGNNFNFSGYYRFKNIVTQEEVVASKTELSTQYDLDHTKVCAICNGKRKSCHKWICLGTENKL